MPHLGSSGPMWATDYFCRFMKNFGAVSQEIQTLGLEQFSIRQREIADYRTSVQQAAQDSFRESRECVKTLRVN